MFAGAVLDALFISARALTEGALENPLAWLSGVGALALTGLWLYLVRRLVPKGFVQ